MRNIWPGPFGLAEGERDDTVVWVGTMRPIKRPELVIDLARLMPDIRFVVVGGPSRKHTDLFERTRRAAEELPNADVVGFVPVNDVDRYFLNAALLLNTSAVEGFPNTFLHAWGRHKPVVSMYDPNGMLAGRGFGRCAPTVEELAAAIRELCGDRPLRRRIGAAACDYVRRYHAPHQVIAELERNLLGLVGAASR
jgi:glycosyltransferase involved in cell wall biosynthesis